jgi:chemotaxis protein MotB
MEGQTSPFEQDGSPIPPINQQNSQPAFQMGSISADLQKAAEQQDLDNLKQIQEKVEDFARTHGFSGRLKTSIDQQGLVVQLLTDEVLFDSGHAVLKKRSLPLLNERADAVLEYLLAHGVAPKRLSLAGYADQRPVATNETAEGRGLNRRVNLVVLRRSFQGSPTS